MERGRGDDGDGEGEGGWRGGGGMMGMERGRGDDGDGEGVGGEVSLLPQEVLIVSRNSAYFQDVRSCFFSFLLGRDLFTNEQRLNTTKTGT